MIYAYKQGSNSAKLLGDKLKMKRIKHDSSTFKGYSDKLVINWGASEVPMEVSKCTILNKPELVQLASNKKSFFEAIVSSELGGEINIPNFTTSAEEAEVWIKNGRKVVVREKLTGHSGEGIVLLEDGIDWSNYNHSNARLYVEYIPKKEEYRVHVVRGDIVDVRRKALRSDFPKNLINWQVRNHGNGFIYQKDGFTAPQDVLSQATLAIKAIGLDFGAVDVIWNNYHNKAFVLEVNTAPGLEGSTVDNYAAAFAKILVEEPKFYKTVRVKEAMSAKQHYEQLLGEWAVNPSSWINTPPSLPSPDIIIDDMATAVNPWD